jgi:hypothetical protein
LSLDLCDQKSTIAPVCNETLAGQVAIDSKLYYIANHTRCSEDKIKDDSPQLQEGKDVAPPSKFAHGVHFDQLLGNTGVLPGSCDFDINIHPVLAEEVWTGNIDYEVIKPALRLVSHIFDSDPLLRYVHALFLTTHEAHHMIEECHREDANKLIGPAADDRHEDICCDGPLCVAKNAIKETEITGPRYHCMVCLNTDYCAACRAGTINSHDPSHTWVKFENTWDLEDTYLRSQGNTNRRGARQDQGIPRSYGKNS